MLRWTVLGVFALLVCFGAAQAQEAVEPLTLELRSSRELCTAGTLTEVSWEIAGGTPPYALTIGGETVDLGADNVRVNCGVLTEAEAADTDAALPPKRVTATVTDSRGVQRKTSLDVARARALPAPTELHAVAQVGVVNVYWRSVTGAASQFPPQARNEDGYPIGPYLIRYREVDEAVWRYDRRDGRNDDWQYPGRAIFELQIAALRHPLEEQTSAALRWSETLRYAEHRAPQNVVASATHDTVTVSWDRQPYGGQGFATVWHDDGVISRMFNETEESGRWLVQFRHLPPDTAYTVEVHMTADRSNPSTTVPVRTQAAPPGTRPLPRGAKNLTATATHDRITIRWNAPFEGAEPRYLVQIFEADTNRVIDWDWPYQAPFEYTARGKRSPLKPSTTYRIQVEHLAIPEVTTNIKVTTLPLPNPSAQSADTGASPRGTPPPFEWWADGKPATPLLYLQLTSSRELCTAGTPTEISWQIAGGVPPYTLSVEGSAVDVAADNVRVICGARAEPPAPDTATALEPKRVTATVTDSRGVQRQTSLNVARVRALPAPQHVEYLSYVADVVVHWDAVDGAASQSPRSVHSVTRNPIQISGLVRTRATTDEMWTYQVLDSPRQSGVSLPPLPGLRVVSVAAVRHPLEVETPEALNWSTDLTYAATTEAQNVVISTTHDSITVLWDKQPYARGQGLRVRLTANETGGTRSAHLWEEGVSGRHQVTFAHLPPATAFTLSIFMVDTTAKTGPPPYAVRTKSAPPDWTPQPTSGAQNLRVTTSAEGYTVAWDPPYPIPDDQPTTWFLTIENPVTDNWYTTSTHGTTSWTIPLDYLLPATRYRVIVTHHDLAQIETSIDFTTPAAGAQPLPGAPTLLASTAASGAVALSWITGPSSITKWEYRRQQEGGSWGGWTRIANADASTASHIVSDLTEDVRYSFQLRAVNAAGPGPASATSSAVAGLTPTTLSDREEFSYDILNLGGRLARPGTYAFLTDADDLASNAMTLAEMSTAAALLFNTSDLPGGDYADVLAALQVGDPIGWSPFIHDFCWYDYRVTEILADPPPPSRKLFRIALDEEKTCGPRVHFHDLPATYGWNRPVREPDVGPDGLRVIPPLTPYGLPGYAIVGGHTYRLREGISLSPVVIDVPAGMTLRSNFYGVYIDEASGTYLRLNPLTGKDAEHIMSDGASPTSTELVARFQAMIASIRVVPLPGAEDRPGAPTLAAQTAASGSVALSWSAGPPGATRWEHRGQRQGGGWSEWTAIVGSDAFTASHTVTGLNEDVRYHFQVRAANTGGAGSPSATAVAVAGLTPTVTSERETLSYDNLDSSGGAVRPGSYSFLTDADDLTSGATTFAEASSAEALLLNTGSDTSRYAHVLATVQVGDQITWFLDSRCWYHYRVTEILADPPALGRKLFRIEMETEEPCSGAADRAGNAKNYFDEFRNNVTSFVWGPPPNEPRVGADGIRIMPTDYPVEGGHTYRLVGHRGPAPIVVDIPAGMRFIYVGGVLYGDGRVTGTYIEVVSGGSVTLSPYDVEEAYYDTATPEGETEPPADVVARFEALIASVRKVPLP